MSSKTQNECLVPGCCLRDEECPLQAAGSPQGLWQTHSAWGDIILLLSCCLKTFEKTHSSLTRPTDTCRSWSPSKLTVCRFWKSTVRLWQEPTSKWSFASGTESLQNAELMRLYLPSKLWVWGQIFIVMVWNWINITTALRFLCGWRKKTDSFKRIIFHSLSIAQVRVCEVVIFRPLPHTCKQVSRKYQNHYSSHLQTAF